ncbi:Ger(x)C family spore germination protein [Paenibacillus sp. GCM10012307]
MRKLMIALLMVACLLTGCWDRKEINDLAIITGAAVSLGKQPNELELTLQFYSPIRTGGSGRSSGGASSITRAKLGRNMSEAASRLQDISPRQLFWGHGQVFLISEQLAQQGIEEPLDFMIRFNEPPERINVLICRGEASKVLKWKPKIERDSSVLLNEIGNLDNSLQITLLDLYKMSVNTAGAIILPLVEMEKLSDGEEVPAVNYTAILKNRKLIAVVNKKQTRDIRWITNHSKTASVLLVPDESRPKHTVSVYFQHIRTTLKPVIRGNKWEVSIETQADGSVLENNSDFDLSKPEKMKELQEVAAKAVTERLRSVITSAQQQWNADIFDFSGTFHRKYPGIWNKNKANWDQLFPKVRVTFDVDFNISHTGLINKNIMTNLKEEASQ